MPRQLPFTEKSSRNTFGLGSGHLLSKTLLNGPNHMLLCQYLSFKHRVTIICDMVPGLIVLASCRVAFTGIQNMASVLKHIIFGIRLINQIIAFFQKTRFIHYKFHWDVIMSSWKLFMLFILCNLSENYLEFKILQNVINLIKYFKYTKAQWFTRHTMNERNSQLFEAMPFNNFWEVSQQSIQ